MVFDAFQATVERLARLAPDAVRAGTR